MHQLSLFPRDPHRDYLKQCLKNGSVVGWGYDTGNKRISRYMYHPKHRRGMLGAVALRMLKEMK